MKKINTCNDNIFALSTPVGGAIAVIRASGSGVLPVLREIFSGRIEHRQLNYGKITDRIEPDGGQGEERKKNDTGALAVLDEAMAVYFLHRIPTRVKICLSLICTAPIPSFRLYRAH